MGSLFCCHRIPRAVTRLIAIDALVQSHPNSCSSRAFLSGLWVWNYNKSLEDTTRGLKAVQLFLDGKLLSPPGQESSHVWQRHWSHP